jgi:hypothetical protein
MDMETLTTFFGWCTVINIGILMFTTLLLAVLRDFVTSLHSKIMGVDKEKLPDAYFEYLGKYKIAIIVLNLVPYVSLKLMA